MSKLEKWLCFLAVQAEDREYASKYGGNADRARRVIEEAEAGLRE